VGKRALKSKKQDRIYVIAGSEETLAGFALSELLEGLLSAAQRVTGLLDLDGDKAETSEVLDELRTLPFLADKRVVLVRRADKFVSNNRPQLERYFDNPSPTGVLVLVVSNWQSKTNLAKKLPSVGTLIKVSQPKAWELPGRLVQYAADAHQKKMSREAAELLAELAGDDLGRLYGEVDKLALYVGGSKAIKEQDVESLIGHNRLYSAFAVIDACVRAEAGKAVERLRKMFAEDKSAEYKVVGAFAYHFRKLFTAKKMLAEGDRPEWVAKKAGIWYNKEAQFRQLRQLSLKQIGEQLGELAGIDYAIKRGRAQAKVAMEEMVLKMASE